MKDFFERYSYNCVRLFLNQVAIAIFGFSLAMAGGLAKNHTLQIVTSVFSIIFYLFLEYTVMWEVGAKDRVSIDLGKRKLDLSTPVKMWLLSNSINILLAVFIMLGSLLPNVEVLSNIGGGCGFAALILEGMYTGLLTVNIAPDTPLNSIWIFYYLITLPSLATTFVSYLLGVKNIGSLLVPKKKN